MISNRLNRRLTGAARRLLTAAALLLACAAAAAAEDVHVNVPGNRQWVRTGIRVENGTQIRVSATGTVNTGPTGTFGPEGSSARPPLSSRFLSDGPMYGLILRLTSSPDFVHDELREDYAYANHRTICMRAPGYLWLLVNDNTPEDNSGSFDVTVTRETCGATPTFIRETIIRVVAEVPGLGLPGAEVFVNGRLRGVTDGGGTLRLPPLTVGDRVVARQRLDESPTYRGNHARGSTRDWNFRVYRTSAPVGDDGAVSPFVIPTPTGTHELRLSRSNVLIGLHIVASVEWDASREELENFRDRMLVPLSQFLYNAGDGQFFIEQLDIADDAAYWGDADFRIHADLNTRPNVNLRSGGFLYYGVATWMNMRRSPGLMLDYWSSSMTAAHEFGHYGFDLNDEYADGNADAFCTTNLLQSTGEFRAGQPQASCMMFSQDVAGKLCSNRPENRHRTGTWQGDESCWAHLGRQYRDPSRTERWTVRTPDTRRAIVGQLPTLPADWQPRVHLENRSRPGLCAPLTMVVVNRETRAPVNDVATWVRTSYGQHIMQGTSGSYNSGGGIVRFTPGEIPVTGVHVGDRIAVQTGLLSASEYVVTAEDCAATAHAAPPDEGRPLFLKAGFSPAPPQQQRRLNVSLAPEPFALSVNVEPAARQGEAVIRVRAGAELAAAPSVSVTLSGDVRARPVAMRFEPASRSYVGLAAGLPAVAYASIRVEAAGPDGRSAARFFKVALAPLASQADTEFFSADGQFVLHAPAGAFPAGARVAVGPSAAPPPAPADGLILVSGPFGVAASTGERLRRPGVVRFQLPNLRGERAADGFDPESFEVWRYEPAAGRWEPVGGKLLTSADVLSVTTDRLGDYAVVARPLPDKTDGAGAPFAVTRVTLTPDSAQPSGPCPVLVTFNGQITTNGPGTVRYRFLRSDGATGPVFSLEFKEAGTQSVSTSWTLGGAGLPSYEGWQAIKILSPAELESNHDEGRFQMTCGDAP